MALGPKPNKSASKSASAALEVVEKTFTKLKSTINSATEFVKADSTSTKESRKEIFDRTKGLQSLLAELTLELKALRNAAASKLVDSRRKEPNNSAKGINADILKLAEERNMAIEIKPDGTVTLIAREVSKPLTKVIDLETALKVSEAEKLLLLDEDEEEYEEAE